MKEKRETMNEKKEKFIIFALAGILLLVVCLPVKKGGSTETGAGSGGTGIMQEKSGAESGKGQTDNDSLGNGRSEGIMVSGNGSGISGTGADICDSYVEEMERELEELAALLDKEMHRKNSLMAVGRVWRALNNGDIDRLLKEADERMYEDKRIRYAQISCKEAEEKQNECLYGK